MSLAAGAAAAFALGGLPGRGLAQSPRFPFQPGQVVGFGEVKALEPWLPKQFWEQRRFFLHRDMAIEIGPISRDYAPAAAYREATERFRGTASLGEDGALVGYRAGQPFPVDAIDCDGDPDAGTKLIWNFVQRWQGFGARASFRYTYWDRGERLDLTYSGTTAAWLLKYRPEPQFDATGGDVFEGETRAVVIAFQVDAPPEAAGTRMLTYRYANSFAPLAVAKAEDTWVFVRSLRRIRKISSMQRSAAVAGTDFSFDDLFSFSGLPPQYHWRCLGEASVLAPMNTKVLGYPYSDAENFGPSGLSFARDRWELRRAYRLEMVPKDDAHPYAKKEIWVDAQSFQPIYSFAYDRAGALWKVIYHNHRWSEDELGGHPARDWYPGWEGVPQPRDLRVVSDAILNVQTGTGNRLDFWDSHGTPPTLRKLRRYVDVQRLRRGR